MIRRLKAVLRDWLFKDHKYVTRAQVVRVVCTARWKNRDCDKIRRVLDEILDQL